MSELPAPRATRLARARWLDPRLLAGLALVLVSVVVGAKVLAEADDTIRVWGVTVDLGPQSTLSEGDLVARRVRLDGDPGRYLTAIGPAPVGYVVTRPVGAGELLPAAAVSRTRGDYRRVVVEVDASTTAGLARGRVVDVFAVAEARTGSPAPAPEQVLTAVTVDSVDSGRGRLGGSGLRTGVGLLVDRTRVSSLLAAMTRGRIFLVQVPAGSRP